MVPITGINYVILFGLALLVAGCSSAVQTDSETFPASPESLIGKWRGLPRQVADEAKRSKEGQKVISRMEKMGAILIYEFKADHTIVDGSAPGRLIGYWKVVSVEGRTVTAEVPFGGKTFEAAARANLPNVVWKCVFDGPDKFEVDFLRPDGSVGDQFEFSRIKP
jgi:hypothetical protein